LNPSNSEVNKARGLTLTLIRRHITYVRRWGEIGPKRSANCHPSILQATAIADRETGHVLLSHTESSRCTQTHKPTMEDQVDRLVDKTWKKFQQTPRSQRLLIAVSGIPGSGRCSTASKVARMLTRNPQAKQPSPPKSPRESMSSTTQRTQPWRADRALRLSSPWTVTT
jgi:hypothetical protein